jgi:F-type H+-transporting ATPase subunit b
MAEAQVPGGGEAADNNLTAARHGEGMPLRETGEHALSTEEGGIGPTGTHHPDPSVFGLDATVWVSIAMAVFLAVLVFKRVPAAIARGLDSQIAAIRSRLDEAKQLRAEAEALRDEYARKIASIETEAQAMLAHAEEEAKGVLAKAEADAAELTVRRAKMAEDKIAAAERAALDSIRAKAADAATKAAAAIIAQKHDAAADRSLVDRTISGLGRLN